MTTQIGVSLGQKRNSTAICVAETVLRNGDVGRDRHYLVRHLDRLPPGTTFPEVAARVDSIAKIARLKTARSPTVYVDATGLGSPIIDLIKKRAPHALRVVAVYFTHGDRRVEDDRWQVTLGKAWLVSRLQALLQTCQLHLPRIDETRTLAQELVEYEVHVDPQANDRYGAFRVGTHDDLVTALGLAVQRVEEHRSGGMVDPGMY